MGRAWQFLTGGSKRRLSLLVLVCVLVAASADLALLVYQRNTPSVQIIHPAPSSVLAIAPRAGTNIPQTCLHASTAANPIAAENTCPGTTAWQADHPFGDQHAIEAFTVPASVNHGGTIDLYVNTTAPTYSFQLFRMGWYGGAGARLVYTSPTLAGYQQPAPSYNPDTRTVGADTWRHPVQLDVPTTCVSGVYVVKLLSSQGYMRYDLFTVRDDASTAPIVFQTSIYTYQAYNTWGGKSLYGDTAVKTNSASARAFAVSLDRPYAVGMGVGASNGLGDFPAWEYPAVRWLERQGYDMSYQTDADLNASGAHLSQHKLVIVGGHSEYWSTAMRTNITAARDASVSLAFLGANNVYWRILTEDTPLGHDRLIVCYKHHPNDPKSFDPYAGDPDKATPTWRDLKLPENALLGSMYFNANPTPQDGVVGPAASFLLLGSGLEVGDHVPGILGGELDKIFNNGVEPPNTVALFASPFDCSKTRDWCNASLHDTVDSTLYTAASGASVFDAGTFRWSWGLDDGPFPKTVAPHSYENAAFQKFNANLIAYLLHEPLPGAQTTPMA